MGGVSKFTHLTELEQAAKRPPHGEDTWEQKQAWDRANEADADLERLLRNALPALLEVVRAAQFAFTVVQAYPMAEDMYQAHEVLAAALKPLLKEEEG